MARIRIVDEWLRSPVSPPSRYRAIMVVAESWGEQRVLMRAFQTSPDQTRPTIVLHGAELAIGPAGPTPHGEWGIHVEPPADGRAQELRQQLELAAQRLAGSRGKPARLMDESSQFEAKRTNYWAPGSPRDRPFDSLGTARLAAQGQPIDGAHYEPAMVAPPQSATYIPSAAPRAVGPMPAPTPPPMAVASAPVATRAPAPTPVPMSMTPVPQRRRRGWTSPIPNAPARELGSRTQAGFAGAPVPRPRVPRRPDTALPGKKLAKIVGRTMPVGFQLVQSERDVLNALGDHPFLTARQIRDMISDSDPIQWMDRLMSKLASHGLDLIMPGDDIGGEPTYVLRR
ncbi:MAG TPA: hypothetical protein VML75_01870 [Kofleriaceae bacterium]|nr:hypothetical protein [Kofleriaceae bacterium]